MKWIMPAILIFTLLSVSGCKDKGQRIASENGFAVLPQLKQGEAVATFAGGCFWAMQESMIQLKGVNTVISGYAGGTSVNPTYDQVLSKNTGHAESVQIYYNPEQISFEQLLQAFFLAHDPTQLNRQGPDIGSDYRSIAFYRNPGELKAIVKMVNQLEARKYARHSIVTELESFKTFYPAETAHQDYYENNSWDPYIRNVSKPKVMHVRKELLHMIKQIYLQ